MKYLIDSDWVADWLAGRPPAINLLPELADQGLAISLITFGEIYEGIYYATDPAKAEQGFKDFLRKVRVLPLNRAIMQRFARIRGELRRAGQLIGDPDILIGATALNHDLILLTRNVKDFERLPELRLHQ